MFGLTSPVPRARSEHLLLESPRRDLPVTLVILAVTFVVFLLLALQPGLVGVQRVDDGWQAYMLEHRSSALTALALLFDPFGYALVLQPIRLAIACFLVLRRRWWHLAAFVPAIVLSEILVGPLKDAYDRARPLGSLAVTGGTAFPSGQSIAASATLVAAMIALVGPGRHRAFWGVAAFGLTLAVGLRLTYLGMHWLSDWIGGALLGTSIALVTTVIVGAGQRRRSATGAREQDDSDLLVALPQDSGQREAEPLRRRALEGVLLRARRRDAVGGWDRARVEDSRLPG